MHHAAAIGELNVPALAETIENTAESVDALWQIIAHMLCGDMYRKLQEAAAGLESTLDGGNDKAQEAVSGVSYAAERAVKLPVLQEEVLLRIAELKFTVTALANEMGEVGNGINAGMPPLEEYLKGLIQAGP